MNPDNLWQQVAGAVIMGLGPALWEEMRFEEGKILNPALSKYYVPHIDDVPELDVHLLDRPEEKSVGAGETPVIAIAPAIANAVFRAAGQRMREMPIKLAFGVTKLWISAPSYWPRAIPAAWANKSCCCRWAGKR